MDTRKQIVVLQDLGAPLSYVQQELGAYECLMVDDKAVIPDSVTGIITVTQPVDASLLDIYPHLSFVAVSFTGYNHVDLDACKERGVFAYNVPAYSTDSVAELTLGFMIALLRDIPATTAVVNDGGWAYPPGQELKGKKVGIVGTGACGMRVAELATAFGCDVYGWSRTQQQQFSGVGGTYIDSLEELCATVDIVSLHVPLTEETIGLIGECELKAMQPTAYLVNTARGGVVDKEALVQALDSNQIAGVALDVHVEEPMPADDPLRTHPSAIVTPHIAYKTKEALQRRIDCTIQNILQKKQNRIV